MLNNIQTSAARKEIFRTFAGELNKSKDNTPTMCNPISRHTIHRSNKRIMEHRAIPVSMTRDTASARIHTMFGMRTITISRQSIREAAASAMRKS